MGDFSAKYIHHIFLLYIKYRQCHRQIWEYQQVREKKVNLLTNQRTGGQTSPLMESRTPRRQKVNHRQQGCTAVGGGNTSPTTKLYEFYHLPPTVRIFSHCLMHGMTLKVLKKQS